MRHSRRTHKKRKLRIKRVLLLIVFFFAIYYAIYGLTFIKVNNVIIKGNKILSDQEIIEIAKIKHKPSFLLTSNLILERRLLKNNYIGKADVKKGLLSINIKITERRVLFIYNDEKITLDNIIKDKKNIYAPRLINNVPEKKYNRFIKAMNTINDDTLLKISEIYYDPNNVDDDRFLLYVNDGNKVYLTIEKFSKINNYNEIIKTIGSKNGTLYLDYGNYFESN
ncbi:MAG TPA: FtsQ-type POTRA domain-containing protein [Bacilli bacterium]|nr:FtsQ-type POTRA domain-containing protein [Bacilli bacterium]